MSHLPFIIMGILALVLPGWTSKGGETRRMGGLTPCLSPGVQAGEMLPSCQRCVVVLVGMVT